MQAWDDHSPDEQRLFGRLAGAYAAMLDHFDQHLGRLIDTLEQTGQLDDTIVMVMSDNGASQEGGPLGFVNAMGPFNMVKESTRRQDRPHRRHRRPRHAFELPARLGDGGEHAAEELQAEHPRRRDPRPACHPHSRDGSLAGAGELRHQFCHVSDLAPTVLELLGIDRRHGPHR